MLTEWEILRDIDRRIANLENSTDRNLGRLRSEFQLFSQETTHYRDGILDRLAKLEETSSKPLINWHSIIQNLWFKLAVLAALATGNTQLIEAARVIFQK